MVEQIVGLIFITSLIGMFYVLAKKVKDLQHEVKSLEVTHQEDIMNINRKIGNRTIVYIDLDGDFTSMSIKDYVDYSLNNKVFDKQELERHQEIHKTQELFESRLEELEDQL